MNSRIPVPAVVPAFLVLLALSSSARASTIEVKQDGTGQATSIGAGIALASAGDTVLVHPGVYAEAIVIDKNVVVRSVAGPQTTIIDAFATNHITVTIQGQATAATLFEGFTVRGGTDSFEGAGISVVFCSPVVRNNVVQQNAGSGMSARGAGTPLFEGNLVVGNMGSGFFNWSSRGTLRNNQFVSNTEFGIELYNDFPALIEGNLIVRNRLGGIEGTIPSSIQTLEIANNTIVRNRFGVHLAYFADQVTLRRNIVVSNLRQGIRSGDPYTLHPVLIENDVWNNHAGDYQGPTPGPSDIHANPVFCAPGSGDFHFWWGSPCVLGPAAWIGAFGPGC